MAASNDARDDACRVRLRGSVTSRREMSKRLVFLTVAELARHGCLPLKSGTLDGERHGAQRRRQIEVLCDLSRWQGEGDFYIETKLLRTETELELEGVCSFSQKRGEPRIPPFPSPVRLISARRSPPLVPS